MDADLKHKLSRLGVTKGFKALDDVPRSETRSVRTEGNRLPGSVVATPLGKVWVDRRAYPLSYRHGCYPLAEGLQTGPDVLGLLGVPELGDRPAFIDTETTGLAGGAGTLAFLIGVGVLEAPPEVEAPSAGSQFCLHLVFLRTPEEEGAALHYLERLLTQATGLVTFNGRGFDLPILETRFTLHRKRPAWLRLPHLDLLLVARTLWRDHLPSRRLGALETEILSIQRGEEDIPSALIPYLYRQYLQTGQTAEMTQVFYHNQVDILSMVSLMAHIAKTVSHPELACLAAGEWVGLGRFYDRVGLKREALEAWARALSGAAGDLDDALATRVWRELGARARQQGAWAEAAAVWRDWAVAMPMVVEPLVELAKYSEWILHDPDGALANTEQAIARALAMPHGITRDGELAELRHRRERLARKSGHCQPGEAEADDV